MKKKNLVTMVATLALTASVMVGATLAYLTAQTDEVTNTFTIGNVKIELEEPNWNPDDAQNLVPGVDVKKDPTVYNTGANDTYVAVTVEGMTDKMICVGFDAVVNEGWIKVNADGSVDTTWDQINRPLVDGIYAYMDILPAGEGDDKPATIPLFDEVVYNGFSDSGMFTIIQVDGVYKVRDDVNGELVEELTFATEQDARNYLDSVYNSLSYMPTSYDLIVKAYAIQTTGFDLVTDGIYTWVAELGIKLN